MYPTIFNTHLQHKNLLLSFSQTQYFIYLYLYWYFKQLYFITLRNKSNNFKQKNPFFEWKRDCDCLLYLKFKPYKICLKTNFSTDTKQGHRYLHTPHSWPVDGSDTKPPSHLEYSLVWCTISGQVHTLNGAQHQGSPYPIWA